MRPGLAPRLRLQCHQPRIQPAASQQLCKRAGQDNATGALRGRQAVDDDQRSAVSHRTFQLGLRHAFALGVERAACFVEQKQQWGLQEELHSRAMIHSGLCRSCPLALPAPVRIARSAVG